MSTLYPLLLHRLDLACSRIDEAFGHSPYLVGSVQERKATATSDFDVRLILPDEEYDDLIRTAEMRTMLDLALGCYLTQMTGLPIDFQIQRMTEANEKHTGQRNPLGGRALSAWRGDAAPDLPDRAAGMEGGA